jgi:hypothetical protein
VNRTILNLVGATAFLGACLGIECYAEDSNQVATESNSSSGTDEVQILDELRTVERQIETKSKELEALRERANELRAKRKAPVAISRIADLQAIINLIPKDSEPRDSYGEEGMFARDRANKWLEDNQLVYGKRMEFSAPIKVEIRPGPKAGVYSAHVELGENDAFRHAHRYPYARYAYIGNVRVGKVEWGVYCLYEANLDREVNEETARRWKLLNGTSVKVSGTIGKLEENGNLFHLSRRREFRSPTRSSRRSFGQRRQPEPPRAEHSPGGLALYLHNISVEGLHAEATEEDLHEKSHEPQPVPAELVSLQEILDRMPKDSQPRDSQDAEAIFALGRANKWIQTDLVSKKVKFTATVSDVDIEPLRTTAMYRGTIQFANGTVVGGGATIGAGTIQSGGIDWNLSYVIPLSGLLHLGEAEARQLLNLKSKSVTISGTVANWPRGTENQFRVRYGDKGEPLRSC